MQRRTGVWILTIAVLGILGVVAYRGWFHNPYRDAPALAPEARSAAGAEGGLLILDATLIDVAQGTAIPATHLRIRGDTIEEVVRGDAPEPPPGFDVLDAGGRYLMPGLIDVHVHLEHGGIAPRESTTTRTVLEQFVRFGVTTVLVLGGPGGNDEDMAELKRAARQGELVSPLLFGTGDGITAPGSHPVTTTWRMAADMPRDKMHERGITVLAEGEDPGSIVQRKAELGLDGVKVIVESGPPPWRSNPRLSAAAVAAVVGQARRQGLPVHAHISTYDEFVDALEAGAQTIMHTVSDARIEDAWIDQMRRDDVFYVPTLSVFWGLEHVKHPQTLPDDLEGRGVSRRALRSLENPLFLFGFGRMLDAEALRGWMERGRQNLVRLHRAGVPIAMGTDTGSPFVFPGHSAHLELQLMAEAGLDNAEVLRIATLQGARLLGLEGRVGALEAGQLASAILLRENPLEDVHHTLGIERVILAGRVIDPGAGSGE